MNEIPHEHSLKKTTPRIKGSKEETKQRAGGKLGSFQTLGVSLVKLW